VIDMSSRVVDKGAFDILKIIDEFLRKNSDGRSGAILIFIGIARRKGLHDKDVTKLLIESYREMANEKLNEISADLIKKYNLNDCLIVHAEGEFNIGEPLVFVGIAKQHRDNLFNAMSEAIVRYKTEPPLFKKEIYKNGSGEWIGSK